MPAGAAWCQNEEVSERPTLAEIERAADRLRDVIVRTPLLPLHDFSGPGDVLLKLETLQPVTNFKIRGVYNAAAVLPVEERSRGLSTVSAGNTAQALAWTGRHLGVPARSLMPDTAPRTKIDAVRRYGGEPVLVPTEEVFRFLRERGWEKEPFAFIHPWTNRDLMIGHGTPAPPLQVQAIAPWPPIHPRSRLPCANSTRSCNRRPNRVWPSGS